jgi:hypothetical protein
VRSVSTATTKFTFRDDGIVFGIDINPDTERTAQNVSDAMDMLNQLVEGQARPGLWDPRPGTGFPAEAWTTLIRRLPESISALAILADDRVRQGIGGFPAAIDSLLIPVRVFADEAEATEWLLQFVDA